MIAAAFRAGMLLKLDEPSKDTFWMSLPGFAGIYPVALSTAVEQHHWTRLR